MGKESGGSGHAPTRRGFYCSASEPPLHLGQNLIVIAGGEGGVVAAMEQAFGRIVWKALSFQNAYNSPILISDLVSSGA